MVSSRTPMVRAIAGTVVLTAFMLLLTFAAHSASLSVSENGSTLILPLFKNWVSAYAKVDPDLHMMLGGDGSEAGIDQAIANHVQIGTSDAYMSDTQAMAHPNILNIPLAISAQTVVLLENCAVFAATVTKFVLHAPVSYIGPAARLSGNDDQSISQQGHSRWVSKNRKTSQLLFHWQRRGNRISVHLNRWVVCG